MLKTKNIIIVSLLLFMLFSSIALAVNTYGIITEVWNNASSSVALNDGEPVTCTTGTSVLGKFSLGAAQQGQGCSSISVKALIQRKGTDTAENQTAIVGYLNGLYSVY